MMRFPINLIATAAAAMLVMVSCGAGGNTSASSQDPAQGEATAQGAAQGEVAPAIDSTRAALPRDSKGRVRYRPDTAMVYYDGRVNPDSTFIVISKRQLRLNVYGVVGGDTTLLAHYPVCLSRNLGPKAKSGDMRTPESQPGKPFHIKQIQDASTWKHDFGDGRGNILSYGHWFMRLATPFNGIGIHGSTNNEDRMPGRDSEGCIRLRDGDLEHLHDTYAHVGMPVTIKAEDQGDLPFETRARRDAGHRIDDTPAKPAAAVAPPPPAGGIERK